MESNTNSRSGASLRTIHGFRVQSYGRRLSTAFERGLRRLAERGFDDASCVLVKTTSGSRSGITHAGGRYVHPDNFYRCEVVRQMRELGLDPPPPPFILAPGEYTLYHEWGHHVDRTWSGEDQEIFFSFRWLSRFYSLCVRPSRTAHAAHGLTADDKEFGQSELDAYASDAAVVWWHTSSELFANLFEDWLRAEKKVVWDDCEPKVLNASEVRGHPFVRIALLQRVRAEDVRAETYALFKAGIRSAVDLPPVRPCLFGENTDEVVGQLCSALRRVRNEGLQASPVSRPVSVALSSIQESHVPHSP